MYGILFRDINPRRTLIDQHFSRRIIALSRIVIHTGEDNYLTTADAIENGHQVLASQFINERFAANARQTPQNFITYLRSIGSSERTLKRQIRGELSWQRLQRRQIEPFVTVGDDEVRRVMASLEARRVPQRDGGQDAMRASRQSFQHPHRFGLGLRLAEQLTVEHDGRVGGEHGPRVPDGGRPDRLGFRRGKTNDVGLRQFALERLLGNRGGPDLERHADLAQQLATPRRRGRQVHEILFHSRHYSRDRW
jgi:hypothetical protein